MNAKRAEIRGLNERLVHLAASLASLDRWPGYLTALALGVGSVLAWPPFFIVPILIPTLVGLIWLLDGATSKRRAFAIGWWFGLGHFGFGLHWMVNAFFIRGGVYDYLSVPAVFALACGAAIYIGLVTLLVHLSRTDGILRGLVFMVAWMVAEWLRGILFTGLPWNLTATVWGAVGGLHQGAALIGSMGLGALTIAAAVLPGLMLTSKKSVREWLGFGAVYGLLLAVFVWGLVRLDSHSPWPNVEGVVLRLVQPAIAQDSKWDPELRLQHIAKQMALSSIFRDSGELPTHVIWAETAVPAFLGNNDELRRAIATSIPENGLLITGAIRKEENDGRISKLWNSLFVLDAEGDIEAVYDKAHLVPFGEYIPFKGVPGLSKLTEGLIDYSPGPGRQTVTVEGLPPFSPLICYEVIFPGDVINPEHRPDWIVNLTNDAWFGQSIGPHQHFAAARLRAVEEGLPVIRVANSGISGVIDPFGRVIQQIPLGQSDSVDSPLPRPLENANIQEITSSAIKGCFSIFLLLIVFGRKFFQKRCK